VLSAPDEKVVLVVTVHFSSIDVSVMSPEKNVVFELSSAVEPVGELDVLRCLTRSKEMRTVWTAANEPTGLQQYGLLKNLTVALSNLTSFVAEGLQPTATMLVGQNGSFTLTRAAVEACFTVLKEATRRGVKAALQGERSFLADDELDIFGFHVSGVWASVLSPVVRDAVSAAASKRGSGDTVRARHLKHSKAIEVAHANLAGFAQHSSKISCLGRYLTLHSSTERIDISEDIIDGETLNFPFHSKSFIVDVTKPVVVVERAFNGDNLVAFNVSLSRCTTRKQSVLRPKAKKAVDLNVVGVRVTWKNRWVPVLETDGCQDILHSTTW
jgi:hypothetical protein